MRTQQSMKLSAVLAAAIGMIAIASNNAHAQGGSSGMGGGGDILICQENGGIKRYLLDTYEEKDSYAIDAGNGRTLEDRTSYVLTRLRKLDPSRADRYAADASMLIAGIKRIRGMLAQGITPTEINKIIKREANADPKITAYVLAAEIELKDIDDADELYDYRAVGCEKKQLVRQENNLTTGKLEFTINFNYFNAFGEDDAGLNQQVATVLHESIYHERRELGARTSKDSRTFNRYILDPSFEIFPSCRYAREIVALGFDSFDILGVQNSKRAKYTCTADDQIEVLNDVNYAGLRFSKLTLKNGRVPSVGDLSLNLLFTAPKVGEKLKISHKPTNLDVWGGILTFRDDATIKWDGVSKYKDSGYLSVLLDSELKVLSIQNTGYYSGPVADFAQADLTEFARKVKELEPNFSTNEAEINRIALIVSWIRQGIPTKEYNRIKVGLNALTDRTIIIPQIQTEKAAVEWVKAFSQTRISRCILGQAEFVLASGLALRLGKASLKCYADNGDQITYRTKVLLPLASGGGVGVSVYKGDIPFTQDANDDVVVKAIDVDSGLTISGRNVSNEVSSTDDNGSGFGLLALSPLTSYADDDGSIKWTFKARKRTRGIFGKVEQLLDGIEVDRAVYPAHQ